MDARSTTPAKAGGLRVSETVLGILGAITTFLGGFILFAGDDQYIGLGGEASWRVEDVASAWGFGLAALGIAALVGAVALYQRDRRRGPVDATRDATTDFAVHATVFTLVNAFLWIQDVAIGGGLNYALWITIPWGIGLAVHAFVAHGGPGRHAAVH
jgi:hypothetical protein